MSSTPHVSRSRKIRGVAVAAVAVALIAAAFSGEGAQATGTTVTVFGAESDTGVVDTNHDGAAEWNSYGPTNNGLNVGETGQDGWDLRYVVPFTLTDSVRAGVENGATAKLRFRIWQVMNLGPRQLKVEALEGDLQGRADYARTGIVAASLTPIKTLGGTAAEVDVTSLLRNIASPIVTFRFSLDSPAWSTGSSRTSTSRRGERPAREPAAAPRDDPRGREADRGDDRGARTAADDRRAEDGAAADRGTDRRRRRRPAAPTTTTPTTKPATTHRAGS